MELIRWTEKVASVADGVASVAGGVAGVASVASGVACVAGGVASVVSSVACIKEGGVRWLVVWCGKCDRQCDKYPRGWCEVAGGMVWQVWHLVWQVSERVA